MISFDADLFGPWVAARSCGKWYKDRGTAIGKITESSMAGVIYQDYNGSCVTAHIAAEGNWATKTFLWIIFDYPFRQIGAKMILAPVCSTNAKSIKMLEHMGFVKEGELLGATSEGDLLLYVMRKENCKYLRGRYGQKCEHPSGS